MRYAFPLVLAAFLASAPAVLAGPQVPDVGPADLPVAGTTAPFGGASATRLTVGNAGWYRLNDDPADVQAEAVRAHLEAASVAARNVGGSHEVWIVVSRMQPWARIVEIRQFCEQTGVFRVGVVVRSESGGREMGFPLFLPPPSAGAEAPAGTARVMKVRLVRPVKTAVRVPVASAPDRLYEAARRAVEHFGPIVATASIRWDVPVGDAVHAIDLLYRAGCAAVRLPYLVMAHPNPEPILEIWVQERLLEEEPLGLEVPPVAPRSTPWPDHGAGEPGALTWTLEPIPSRDAPSPEAAARLKPLFDYAAGGHEVPIQVMQQVNKTVHRWGRSLGTWLKTALRPGRVDLPETLLIRSNRQGMGAGHFFAESRRVFPGPDHVVVATARLKAFLFRGPEVVGQVDVTLSLSGDSVDVVFAHWIATDSPEHFVLPPRETDPYAAGMPGYFRVWLEGLLAAARRHGPSAVPLAPEAEVLSRLPQVAHAGVRGALARRAQGIEHLVGWLRAKPYDRVSIGTAEGSAAVVHAGRVVGVLRFGLAPERGELSLATLTPLPAPR